MSASNHPYLNLPDSAFWRQSVAKPAPEMVDPVGRPVFCIRPTDRVATAGSCFAQHIARYLKTAGFNYFIAESGHPKMNQKLAAEYQYGTYSARFGNLYTSRQLLQLYQRAYGEFLPEDSMWEEPDGTFSDPFRPTINPNGFSSIRELNEDRRQHFAGVRKMLEELDVLVFTLGLTECWISRVDGAAYPLCPGTAKGKFDPAKHAFINLSVDDVIADLTCFMEKLRGINPRARVIFTVSPVPLVATASGEHVLAATTLSKSILRVAADMVCRRFSDVAYFPSYEIITGSYARGRYFASDLRSVTEPGVEHVMRLFLLHYAAIGGEIPAAETAHIPTESDALENIVGVMCEEEALQRGN